MAYNLTVEEMNELIQTVLLGKEQTVFGENAEQFKEDFKNDIDSKPGAIIEMME